MRPARRVLVPDATYEDTHSGWPVLRCSGCGVSFVWIFEGHEKAKAPRYHSKGCKRGAKAKPVVASAEWIPVRVTSQRCPACGKIAAPTLESAKMEKARIEKATGRRDTVRYYTCESGYIHWTRMDAMIGAGQ